jgi:uncharacterized protein YaiL (DUF2058 family)
MMKKLAMQKEQLEDLDWAKTSIETCDGNYCQVVAHNMIDSLSRLGASSLVKKSAASAQEKVQSLCASCPKFMEILNEALALSENYWH